MIKINTALAAVLIATLSGASNAQAPAPDKDSLADAWPSQTRFSPYAGRNFPGQVYWGDTHLHTSMSFDAGAFGARLTPEDAYRFARGEEVTSSGGLRVKLSRPLDFRVVAVDSDKLGLVPSLLGGEASCVADGTGRRWCVMVEAGGS